MISALQTDLNECQPPLSGLEEIRQHIKINLPQRNQ